MLSLAEKRKSGPEAYTFPCIQLNRYLAALSAEFGTKQQVWSCKLAMIPCRQVDLVATMEEMHIGKEEEEVSWPGKQV